MNDPVNSLTFTQLLASKAQATNNTASAGVDIRDYAGTLAVHVNLGVKTAGDNDGTVTVLVQASATNSAAAATNISSTTFSVNTTNNTAAIGQVLFDKRAEYRYVFARIVLTGTNSPSYPVSATLIGRKQVQP